MKKITIFALMVLFVFSTLTYSQTGLKFSLANGKVTNERGAYFFEFDVMLSAERNSQFVAAQIYLNYNTLGFGESIVSNGKVTLTKGNPLLNPVFGPGGAIPGFGPPRPQSGAESALRRLTGVRLSDFVPLQRGYGIAGIGHAASSGSGAQRDHRLGTEDRQPIGSADQGLLERR